MPEFLAATKYKNPEGLNGIFQFARNSDMQVFKWTNQDPKRLKAFNTFMGGHRRQRTPWFDAFSVDEILLDGYKADKDTALMIDVGGGSGYDIESFRARYPSVPGRLILQDASEVIGGLPGLHQDIEPMDYDFFTPQPVKDRPSNLLS